MADLDAVLKLSLGVDQLSFEMDGQNIQLDQGLSLIESQSIRHGQLDALVLEHMIYVIEEILEQFKLDYKIQRSVQTSDIYMQQLSELFFNGETMIDRIKLEHAFNTFIERIAHYQEKVGSDLKLFVYFVFIREMMHHCNVVNISVQN